jgi:hypothetical protein
VGPIEWSLIFGAVLFFVVGLVHQLVRPKERRYRGLIWFLRLWEIRPTWCYLIGACLAVAAIVRAVAA